MFEKRSINKRTGNNNSLIIFIGNVFNKLEDRLFNAMFVLLLFR
jgi:hypothetical protein